MGMVTDAPAQLLQRAVALQNARILTMDGRVLEKGTVLIQGSRIKAIGEEVELPLLVKKVDANSLTITPGLIDSLSFLGRTHSGAASASPARRAEDAFDRYDSAAIQEALSQGVTAIYLSPRGPVGIAGTGAVLRLEGNPEEGPVGTVLRSEAALCIDLDSDGSASSRLKTLYDVRKKFDDALAYRRNQEDYNEDLAEYTKKLLEQVKKKNASEAKKKSSTPNAAGDKPKPYTKPESKPDSSSDIKKPRRPSRNLDKEMVLRALDRKMPVRIWAHRSSDILNALNLAETYSLDLILEGATEAHLVADKIAAARASVVLGRMDRGSYPSIVPFRRANREIGETLNGADLLWTVGSGTESPSRARFVVWNAQLATSRTRSTGPLELVTAKAARILDVENQIGQLRPGMLADVVLWDGDPLDPAARVKAVYVGGKQVYQRSSER